MKMQPCLIFLLSSPPSHPPHTLHFSFGMDSNEQEPAHAPPSPPKQHRRKSWLHGSSLASLFSSSRGGADHNRASAKRSQSLDASAGMTRSHSTRSLSKSSSIVSKLSRATRHGLRRLPTSIDLRKIPEDSPPPPPKTELPEFTESGYLLTVGEEEADRQQLKNDLVKLAFEGWVACTMFTDSTRVHDLTLMTCFKGNLHYRSNLSDLKVAKCWTLAVDQDVGALNSLKHARIFT